MTHPNVSRRNFVQNTAMALSIPSIPLDAWAQATLKSRLEWQSFKVTTQYDSLLQAFTIMQANTNANDPNSWPYWANIHFNRCPHGVPYFLAWHRGYLYYFEQQLRKISGNPNLVLPYWDYYTNATIPTEFTNASANNPLYAERLNLNVRQALTLAPFSNTLINFQRGTSNAYEPSFENAPHNPIHDIIGDVMSTMQSPLDPIFWLHHANVDRLWVAWVAAGSKRKMPGISNSYWSGSHIYTSTLSMQRKLTYDTRNNLQYYYQNEKFPTSIPIAEISSPKLFRVQATQQDLIRTIPPVGTFKISGPRATSDTAYSLGGALNVGLDRHSISAQLPIPSDSWQAIHNIMNGNASSLSGTTKNFKSLHIVLDNVEITEIGKKGGYYYQIFLNFPSSDGKSASLPVLIGTLGAFQINGAMHHGNGTVQIKYPIDRGVFAISGTRGGMATISFVRVDGDNSPDEATIGIAEARLEASTEDTSP